MSTKADQFPTSTEGLSEAQAPELVELSDGDRFELRIAPVAKRVGDSVVRMLAYNGSIPGPVLRLPERSQVDAAGEPLRRNPRDASGDPRRREV